MYDLIICDKKQRIKRIKFVIQPKVLDSCRIFYNLLTVKGASDYELHIIFVVTRENLKFVG